MLKEQQISPLAIAKLAAQAREAYEQKRTRECIALTKELALADPGNAEALALESAIRSGIQRDLSDARALLDDARKKTDGQKYRKAAEIILLKTLNLDPSNEEARLLLANARASAETTSTPAAVASPARTVHPDPHRMVSQRHEPIPFTAPIQTPIRQTKTKERTASKLPLVIAATILVSAGVLLTKPWSRTTEDAVASPIGSTATPPEFDRPAVALPTPDSGYAVSEPAGPSNVVSSPPPVVAAAAAAVPKAVSAPAAGGAGAVVPASPAVLNEFGMLAISSPVAADIYLGDKNLGSTPTTLRLPAGSQTIEYRYKDLRTVATHLVKTNETTTALINFEVTVQINARPWAQVFVEGTPRKALGQTPLSDTRVPIGSVLVFENPNFQSKNYRVAAGDTTIQMVFP